MRTTVSCCVLAAVLAVAYCLAAQPTFTVRGIVQGEDHRAIAGARVWLIGTRPVTTKPLGAFEILVPGDFVGSRKSLRVEADGFQAYYRDVVVPKDALDVVLKPVKPPHPTKKAGGHATTVPSACARQTVFLDISKPINDQLRLVPGDDVTLSLPTGSNLKAVWFGERPDRWQPFNAKDATFPVWAASGKLLVPSFIGTGTIRVDVDTHTRCEMRRAGRVGVAKRDVVRGPKAPHFPTAASELPANPLDYSEFAALRRGMSIEDVRHAWGAPKSVSTMGSRTRYNYGDHMDTLVVYTDASGAVRAVKVFNLPGVKALNALGIFDPKVAVIGMRIDDVKARFGKPTASTWGWSRYEQSTADGKKVAVELGWGYVQCVSALVEWD